MFPQELILHNNMLFIFVFSYYNLSHAQQPYKSKEITRRVSSIGFLWALMHKQMIDLGVICFHQLVTVRDIYPESYDYKSYLRAGEKSLR